jgi:hypothetical protein
VLTVFIENKIDQRGEKWSAWWIHYKIFHLIVLVSSEDGFLKPLFYVSLENGDFSNPITSSFLYLLASLKFKITWIWWTFGDPEFGSHGKEKQIPMFIHVDLTDQIV